MQRIQKSGEGFAGTDWLLRELLIRILKEATGVTEVGTIEQGAKQAVENCLRVRTDEKAVIITDIGTEQNQIQEQGEQ